MTLGLHNITQSRGDPSYGKLYILTFINSSRGIYRSTLNDEILNYKTLVLS